MALRGNKGRSLGILVESPERNFGMQIPQKPSSQLNTLIILELSVF